MGVVFRRKKEGMETRITERDATAAATAVSVDYFVQFSVDRSVLEGEKKRFTPPCVGTLNTNNTSNERMSRSECDENRRKERASELMRELLSGKGKEEYRIPLVSSPPLRLIDAGSSFPLTFWKRSVPDIENASFNNCQLLVNSSPRHQ